MGVKGLINDLVSAIHILYRAGIVDGFGHVGVRREKDPERFPDAVLDRPWELWKSKAEESMRGAQEAASDGDRSDRPLLADARASGTILEQEFGAIMCRRFRPLMRRLERTTRPWVT